MICRTRFFSGVCRMATLALASVSFAAAIEPASANTDDPGLGADDRICMIRSGEEGETAIVLPTNDREAMMAKGFVDTPCGSAFAGEEDQRRFRDRICYLTASQNENVQQQLEALLGERPAVLCGMAEQVLGQWQRLGEVAIPQPVGLPSR